jgi:hypothetical protein
VSISDHSVPPPTKNCLVWYKDLPHLTFPPFRYSYLFRISCFGFRISAAVRKDQPFTLDFSNKPEVLFASPAKDRTFHPGETISVKAVLIDPKLDLMIRNLDDTQKRNKKKAKPGDGKPQGHLRDESLDPVVTISDSSGKTVSEGPMPFG